MKKIIVFIAILTLMLSGVTVWAGAVTIPNVFTPDTPAKADSVNENFSALAVEVNDHANKISMATTRRLFIPAALPETNFGRVTMPNGIATRIDFSTTDPRDFVYSGPDSMSYTVMFMGCEGTQVAYTLYRRHENIGVHPNIIIIPAIDFVTPSVSGISSFTVTGVTKTFSLFADRKIFVFTRLGAHAQDTCSGDIEVTGLIIEYPTWAAQ